MEGHSCRLVSKMHEENLVSTVESLELVVDQFSWYSLVALPHEFTSSRKTNLERNIFPTETENQLVHEFTSPRISKYPTIQENWPP